MKIELKEIAVRELVDGFRDEAENGVTACGGKLDIRPKYQREFIYTAAQQQAVMDTVLKGFPLNTMYWAVRGDGTFEVIDGQQRTLSLCKFVAGDFSVPWRGHPLFFGNLQDDEREKVLGYKLMVYLCEGSDAEKLEWFKTINIAGEELTAQELRNAVYAGRGRRTRSGTSRGRSAPRGRWAGSTFRGRPSGRTTSKPPSGGCPAGTSKATWPPASTRRARRTCGPISRTSSRG